MQKTRFRKDRGATVVLMAFGMVGLMAFGGLVLDGGNAFSQRRQMQNAADASATAGANELYRYKTGATGTDVYGKALAVAVDNGATSGTFTCVLVLYTGDTESGTTPCQGASNPSKDSAWKVRVGVDSTHGTRLMRVVGITSFKAGSGAAASLLAGTVVNSPFMLCVAPGTAHNPPLLVQDLTDPTGWAINPNAVGREYDIWGNAIKDSDCGIKGKENNDFRGLVDNEGSYEIPGVWPADSGNKAGHDVGATLVGGCDLAQDTQIKNIPVGCEFGIPLCDAAAGPKSLHCVKVGRFKTILDSSNTSIRGIFLGGGLITSGAGGGIPTSAADAMIIKLTE